MEGKDNFEFNINDKVILKGNKRTFIIHDCIKKYGGIWNSEIKCWEFHKQTNIDELRIIFNKEYLQQLDDNKRRQQKIKRQVIQEEIREHNIGAVKYSIVEAILSKHKDILESKDEISMNNPDWDIIHLYAFVIPIGKRKARWMRFASINDRRKIKLLEEIKSVLESQNIVCKIERDDFK